MLKFIVARLSGVKLCVVLLKKSSLFVNQYGVFLSCLFVCLVGWLVLRRVNLFRVILIKVSDNSFE